MEQIPNNYDRKELEERAKVLREEIQKDERLFIGDSESFTAPRSTERKKIPRKAKVIGGLALGLLTLGGDAYKGFKVVNGIYDIFKSKGDENISQKGEEKATTANKKSDEKKESIATEEPKGDITRTPATTEDLQRIVENNLLNNNKERLRAIVEAGGMEGHDGKGKTSLIMGDFIGSKSYKRLTTDGKLEIYENGVLTETHQLDKDKLENTVIEHTNPINGKNYLIKIIKGKFVVVPNPKKEAPEHNQTSKKVKVKPTFVNAVEVIESETATQGVQQESGEERLNKIKQSGIEEHTRTDGKKYWTQKIQNTSIIKELRFENGTVSYYDKDGKKLGDPVKLSEQELKELKSVGVSFK
jgi:hypothetical protein